MSNRNDDGQLRDGSQSLLSGALKHAKTAALAAALVPLAMVTATPAIAQDCGSGGCPSPCEGSANPPSLWPPNHAFHEVAIVGATPFQYVSVIAVTQDEALDVKGSGRTRPDALIDGDEVLLRAERTGTSGTDNGRVYEIHYVAGNADGSQCEGATNVVVPHDLGGEASVIDDGQIYDSTGP